MTPTVLHHHKVHNTTDCSSPLVEERSAKLNYHTYMKKTPCERWSKSQTELFYEAIRQFGTDLTMIQQLFPGRTRQQVKLKFKRKNASILCRFQMLCFLVLKIIHILNWLSNDFRRPNPSKILKKCPNPATSMKEKRWSQDVDEWSQFGDFNSAYTPEDLEKKGTAYFEFGYKSGTLQPERLLGDKNMHYSPWDSSELL